MERQAFVTLFAVGLSCVATAARADDLAPVVRGVMGPDGNWHVREEAPPTPVSDVVTTAPSTPASAVAAPVQSRAVVAAVRDVPGPEAGSTDAVAATEARAVDPVTGTRVYGGGPLSPSPLQIATPIAYGDAPVPPAPSDPLPARETPPPARPRDVRVLLAPSIGVGNFVGPMTATYVGPVWGMAGGIEYRRWLAFEVHYDGIASPSLQFTETGGRIGLVGQGVSGMVRVTAPLPVVRPFVAAGFGGSWYGLYDADQNANVTYSTRHLLQVPIAAGIELRPFPAFGIAAEGGYRVNFDQDAPTAATTATTAPVRSQFGDLWSADVAFRFYL